MMNTQQINKAAVKSNPKTNTTKVIPDQEKAINQLKQEIRTLTKTVKEMQQKPDTQAVNIAIPRKLLSRVNSYLLDYTKDTGETVSLSELTCDALDAYLWGEKENQRLEDERKKDGLENGKKGK